MLVWQLADELIQRITEVNLVLPFLSILIHGGHFYSRRIWVILGATIALSILPAPSRDIVPSLSIERVDVCGSCACLRRQRSRIVFTYMIPRMIPLLIPGLVLSVPAFVFLEAGLAVLGLGDPVLPTWGKMIDDANRMAHYTRILYWILGADFSC